MSNEGEQISDAEAQECLDLANASARRHTDVLLRVPRDGGDAGLASCLHLQAFGRALVVTCNHVLKADHVYFTAAVRTATSSVDEQTAKHNVSSLTLLLEDRELDLAVFDGSSVRPDVAGKERYALEQSDWFNVERLAPDGTGAVIYGVWGERAKAYQYPDGLFFLDAPIYTGLGPIVFAEERLLLADMAEVRFLQAAERFRAENPTGGVRDLEGISGSALWVILDGMPRVAGIVLGRKNAERDKHLIRVTPAWALRAWLERELGSI